MKIIVCRIFLPPLYAGSVSVSGERVYTAVAVKGGDRYNRLSHVTRPHPSDGDYEYITVPSAQNSAQYSTLQNH